MGQSQIVCGKKRERKEGEDDDKGSGTSRNEEVDFHGEKRTNATHESTTGPEARLYRKGKGKEAKLSYMWHVLMENRIGIKGKAVLVQNEIL